MRANGVSLVANDTMRELEIMMPTGLAMRRARADQYGDHGYDNREQESGEQFNPQFRTPQDAMEDTSTPSSTLQAMRKNAQLPAVA